MASRAAEIKRQEEGLQEELAAARDRGEIDSTEYHGLSWLLTSLSEEANELARVEEEALAISDNPGLPNPVQAKLDGLLRRVNNIVAGASGMLSAVSKVASAFISRIWQFFSEALMEVLQSVAGKLHIQSWSIGITGGVPTGLSGTVTVTFRP